MAHYFFHIRQDRTVFEDRRGGEFADIAAAWNWAMSDAEAIIRDGELAGPVEHYWMDISDRTGATVASMPFARVVQLH